MIRRALAPLLAVLLVALGVVACTPPQENWSAQGYGACPTVTKPVLLDVDVTLDCLTVAAGGELIFDPAASRTLQSRGNVVVEGKLTARPLESRVRHVLRFIGVDESAFVGGGMDVLATDVGLWVMGSGRLDLQGTSKVPWTRERDLQQNPPFGWRSGNQIVAAPSGPNEGYDHFVEAIYPALPPAEPVVSGMPAPEVLNLTRNVVIAGTAAGESHVFIRSTEPSSIRFVEGRFLGPRHDDGSKVLGRYGFHLHHGGNGSLIEGSVVHDTDNHAFVPHNADDVTMLRNIAYDVMETPFWWDPGSPNDEPTHSTNDVLWQENVAAKVSGVRAESTAGFLMGQHSTARNSEHGNRAIGNVAVGIDNPERPADRGFDWDQKPLPTRWTFIDNVAHNIVAGGYGVRTWQNLHSGPPSNPAEHLGRAWIYRTTTGLQLGAYTSQDSFDRFLMAENTGRDFEVHASSTFGAAIVISNGVGTISFMKPLATPTQDTIVCNHTGQVIDQSNGAARYVVLATCP